MAIRSVDENACILCGKCVDVCPMDVLRIEENDGREAVEIKYPRDCICCFNCELGCPTGAIYVDAARGRATVLPW